jgi:hypothetical protein
MSHPTHPARQFAEARRQLASEAGSGERVSSPTRHIRRATHANYSTGEPERQKPPNSPESLPSALTAAPRLIGTTSADCARNANSWPETRRLSSQGADTTDPVTYDEAIATTAALLGARVVSAGTQ